MIKEIVGKLFGAAHGKELEDAVIAHIHEEWEKVKPELVKEIVSLVQQSLGSPSVPPPPPNPESLPK